jgi:hypothetical protein
VGNRLVWATGWCGLQVGVGYRLVWATGWCGQQVGVGNRLVWATGWCGQQVGVGNRLVWATGWCGQQVGVGNRLVWATVAEEGHLQRLNMYGNDDHEPSRPNTTGSHQNCPAAFTTDDEAQQLKCFAELSLRTNLDEAFGVAQRTALTGRPRMCKHIWDDVRAGTISCWPRPEPSPKSWWAVQLLASRGLFVGWLHHGWRNQSTGSPPAAYAT